MSKNGVQNVKKPQKTPKTGPGGGFARKISETCNHFDHFALYLVRDPPFGVPGGVSHMATGGNDPRKPPKCPKTAFFRVFGGFGVVFGGFGPKTLFLGFFGVLGPFFDKKGVGSMSCPRLIKKMIKRLINLLSI